MRLQLLGAAPVGVAELMRGWMPSQWPKIEELVGDQSDYMAGLASPHEVGGVCGTVWWEESFGVRRPMAFIIWDTAYFKSEVE